MAEALGWPQFFVVCALLALPGLLLLPLVRQWFGPAPTQGAAEEGRDSALQSSQS
jgi:PAT family beta-lactamase induction signal transducer AmpG